MKPKTIKHILLAVSLTAGAVGPNATAASVPVVNPSFETNQLFNGTSTTNWNARGNSGQSIQAVTNGWFTPSLDGTLPPPADGTNFVVINISGNPGWVYEDVGPLQSNTTYTLTIAVGASLLGDTGAGRIALINGTSPFQTTLAETLIDTSAFVPGTFEDTNIVFTSGYQVSGDLTILMEGDTGTQLIFDNVRLDATALPQGATALLPTLSTPSGTVYSGTVVTLSENPGGTPPFYYLWQTAPSSLGPFVLVPGATNATLAVDTTPFPLNTPVYYRVYVTNNFGASYSPSVALMTTSGPPVLLVDTLPSSGSADVVGSAVTFSASFDGSRPLSYQWQVDIGGGPTDILGATNSTFTLTNLQFTDTAYYSLFVSNALGSLSSTPVSFTVNPVPLDVNGIIASPANQVGLGIGTKFTPTWVLATNSLLAGASPTNSAGNFQLEGAGGIPVLTDGQFGALSPEGNASPGVATCGTIGSGAGSLISYMLPASASGWDITNLVVYGGWSDNGRDWQRYQVYYSTTADPTNFANLIVDVDVEPVVPSTFQSATRVTITSTNGVLAKNVAGLQWYFNTLANAPENGYEGYAEFQAFGMHSAPAPVLAQNVQPATGADVVGSQVTITASFTSGTSMTFQWYKDGTPIPNATGSTLTLTNLQFSDTAVSPGYVLKASNASGSTFSSACAFTVNPAPDPDASGLLVAPAQQTGGGAIFTPTWTITPGSLIARALPDGATYASTGFGFEGAGGVPVLTDGQFGSVGSAKNGTLATAGSTGGYSLTYLTPSSAYGYDLTNIVVYGGWSDAGRDVQAYTVSYSTVSAPNNFITLDSVNYIPAVVNVPTATRVTLSAPSGGFLANNVAAVRFDFTNPTAKNGYQGYAEVQLFGSPSTPVPMAPVVIQDTIPGGGSDVVGSQVTFAARFAGASPISYQWWFNGTIPVEGATTPTLTLSNLQLTNSGQYSLVASNAYGVTPSSSSTFTVNPVPAPAGGIIAAPANQIGHSGWALSPTWTAATGSLIAGSAPSAVGSGNFATEGCKGTTVLTDGGVGRFYAGNSTLAAAGTSAGTSVTYTLNGSQSGFDLYETVVYAGWNDNGRDGQGYTIAYSSVANPTTFSNLTSASYNPASIPGGTPSADRVSIYSASGGPLAQNVAAVRFTFANVENGWSGYGEIQAFGLPSSAPIAISSTKVLAGHLVLAGSGGTPGGSYSWLTSTNVAAPLATWTTYTTGVFDSNGNFSTSIPINTNVPADFFRLKTP